MNEQPQEAIRPWHKETESEIERNGPWADFAGFERWLSKQDDLLDALWSELDIDQKTALYLAFIGACNSVANNGSAR